MTKPVVKEGREHNRRIAEVLNRKKSELYRTLKEAATALKVPYSTLKHRAVGRKTRVQAHEDEWALSPEEETELVKHIDRLTWVALQSQVWELAEMIRTHRTLEINEPSAIYVLYDSLGEQWCRRFINRHDELEMIIPESIERVRVKESSAAVLQKWFDDVKFIIDTYNIQPQDIYNMHETGFSIGSIHATRVVIDKTQRSRNSAQLGR